jgi:hypothetical protein
MDRCDCYYENCRECQEENRNFQQARSAKTKANAEERERAEFDELRYKLFETAEYCSTGSHYTSPPKITLANPYVIEGEGIVVVGTSTFTKGRTLPLDCVSHVATFLLPSPQLLEKAMSKINQHLLVKEKILNQRWKNEDFMEASKHELFVAQRTAFNASCVLTLQRSC